MNIVLYFKDNGFGLTQDARVVSQILTEAGHIVYYSPPEKPVDADTSIHFEIPATAGIKRSSRSIFFPNFEWFFWGTEVLSRFDLIACKTKQAVEIAKQFNLNSFYTGFTSEDMWTPTRKRAKEFYHIGGQSRLKNTEAVYECWRLNPGLPTLHLYTHVYDFKGIPNNVKFHFGPVTRTELKRVMNDSLFALQPSATEGFGQVLWESLSSGSLLVTTAGDPMQDISPFLVPGKITGYHNMQPVYSVRPEDIASMVKYLCDRPLTQLSSYSVAARELWLKNKAAFKDILLEIV